MKARFDAQAWISDNAISIDPEGDTVWDCTEFFNGLASDYRAGLLEEIDYDGYEALEYEDQLKDDPNAPEWIRRHRGPFSIWVSLT